MSVIEVKNLGVQFETQDGAVYAVTEQRGGGNSTIVKLTKA